jgi:hypothetical protein
MTMNSTNQHNDTHSQAFSALNLSSLLAWYDIENRKRQFSQETHNQNPKIPKQRLSCSTSLFHIETSLSFSTTHLVHSIHDPLLDCNPLPLTNESIVTQDISDITDCLLEATATAEPIAFQVQPPHLLNPVTSGLVTASMNSQICNVDDFSSVITTNLKHTNPAPLPVPRPTKKQKTALDESQESTKPINLFRSYQAEQWTERFEELCEFAKKNGHS